MRCERDGDWRLCLHGGDAPRRRGQARHRRIVNWRCDVVMRDVGDAIQSDGQGEYRDGEDAFTCAMSPVESAQAATRRQAAPLLLRPAAAAKLSIPDGRRLALQRAAACKSASSASSICRSGAVAHRP